MKTNISLALNGLLLLITGYLLIAHFQQKGGQAKETGSAAGNANKEGIRIAYVNSDTLLKNYNYYQDKVKELDAKSQEAETALQSRTRALERDFLQTQQKVQQGLLTPNQVQQEEQRLMQKQQGLAAEQEKLGKQLLEERQKILDELEKQIKDLLTALRKEKNYDYILNYGPGTGVLMVNEELDITDLVLERLNKTSEPEKNAGNSK